MFDKFRQRSLELERLDKGEYTAEEYEGCLIELRRVNRWLGDASALRDSLLAELTKREVKTVSVVDVGAGSGEMLRVIAKWSRQANVKTTLVGVELNERSAKAILEESRQFPEIDAVRGDAFALPFITNRFDYAICSLFTHHFKNEGVVAILKELGRVATRGVFVIDLHRHPAAYYLYSTVGRLFLHNRLIREDGALSILRSFIPQELANAGRSAGLQKVEVTRAFPYRLVLSATPSEKAP